MSEFPIITFDELKQEEARAHSAMAAMVDIDSFILALDDVEKLIKHSSRQHKTIVSLRAEIERLREGLGKIVDEYVLEDPYYSSEHSIYIAQQYLKENEEGEG